MKSQAMIPQVIRSTITMHRVTAELRLAQVSDQLARITTVTRRASELRHERQQLKEQLAAWSYLAVLVEDPEHGAAAMSGDDTLHTCPGRWASPGCRCFDTEPAEGEVT